MTKIAILGASGYTALELVKILLRHPAAEIVVATSRQEDTPRLAELHPRLPRCIPAAGLPWPRPSQGRQVSRPGQHHHGQQERRFRRGATAKADHAFPGVQRERLGLLSRQPPPYAGDRADAERPGRRADRSY